MSHDINLNMSKTVLDKLGEDAKREISNSYSRNPVSSLNFRFVGISVSIANR